MALKSVIAMLLFALALSATELSTGEVLKAKVSCLDCSGNYNFSGIKVLVKCDYVSKLATTESEGSFQVDLPSGITPNPSNCLAKLLGGPRKLYATKKNMVSKVVKAQDSSSYTLSTPLAFSTTCPSVGGKCGGQNQVGSSKTIDLPLPREWGLAPSSYYVPFVPIIGIP